MGITPVQRWRWFLASLHPSQQIRETRQWLALKSTEEIQEMALTYSGPEVLAELRRRGA
jgi:hypothetical protein